MQRYSLRLLALLLAMTFALSWMHHAPASAAPPGTGTTRLLQPDGHGPGLPRELDPDDDDDGVADAVDSHPLDPTRGENPPPGPTDPIADDDGDGLPNVMDPDDNNNGVPDATDPIGRGDPPPTAVPAPTPPPTTSPAPERQSAGRAPSSPSGHAPLVRELPVTGTGVPRFASTLPVMLAGSLVLLAASGAVKRRTRS